MKTRNDIELMAPAGSYESLHAALDGGADAVYFGIGALNMRQASSANFTAADLPGIVDLCHRHGARAYMTLNTVLFADDVTEMQFINVDLPGGYHRVTLDENMEFRYVSRNFQDMTGYSESDLLMTFEGKFINMVHPDDVGKALGRMYALKEGKKPEETPFRIRHKEKG